MYADKTPEATSKEMTTEEAAQEEAAPSSAEAAEGKPVDEAAEGASGSDKPKEEARLDQVGRFGCRCVYYYVYPLLVYAGFIRLRAVSLDGEILY